jgi:hypothetical protein
LRQTTAGSQLLELFAETLNSAHGTLKRLSLHINAKESAHTFPFHAEYPFPREKAPRLRGRGSEMLNVK